MKFAKVLVEIIENTSIIILLVSNSSYMIDVFNQISIKNEILNNAVTFYQTTKNNNTKYKLIDCTTDINEIFESLSEPYD